MAVGVVDVLEAVEVDHQQRGVARTLELDVERAPVERVGQRVARRQPPQLGDVLELPDPAQRPIVLVAQEREVGVAPRRSSSSGRTKRFSHCHVSHSPLRMRHAASTSLWRSSGCVSSWSRRADQLVGAAAEQRAQRTVDAHVLAVGVEQRHPDRHRVERRVERSGGVAVELAQHAQQSAAGEHAHRDVERERDAVGAPARERDAASPSPPTATPSTISQRRSERGSARSARDRRGRRRTSSRRAGSQLRTRPWASSTSAASGSRTTVGRRGTGRPVMRVAVSERGRTLEAAAVALTATLSVYEPRLSVLSARQRAPASARCWRRPDPAWSRCRRRSWRPWP